MQVLLTALAICLLTFSPTFASETRDTAAVSNASLKLHKKTAFEKKLNQERLELKKRYDELGIELKKLDILTGTFQDDTIYLTVLNIQALASNIYRISELLDYHIAGAIMFTDSHTFNFSQLRNAAYTSMRAISDYQEHLTEIQSAIEENPDPSEELKQLSTALTAVNFSCFGLVLATGDIFESIENEMEKRPALDSQPAKFIEVHNGDSMLMEASNIRTDVRLIGVDCPPLDSTGGNKAKEFSKKFFEGGGTVYLEFGQERFDKLNRLLVYIWKNGKMLNEELVKAGLCKEK